MKRFLLWLVGVVLGVGIFLGAVMGVSYAFTTEGGCPDSTAQFGTEALEPNGWCWQVPLIGGKLDKVFASPATLTVQKLGTLYTAHPAITLPDWASYTTLTIQNAYGSIVFVGSVSDYQSFLFPTNGEYKAELSVWRVPEGGMATQFEGGSTGAVRRNLGLEKPAKPTGWYRYAFRFTLQASAEVELSAERVEQGGIVGLRISGMTGDAAPTVETDLGNVQCVRAADGWRAYIPAAYNASSGGHEVNITVNGETITRSIIVLANPPHSGGQWPVTPRRVGFRPRNLCANRSFIFKGYAVCFLPRSSKNRVSTAVSSSDAGNAAHTPFMPNRRLSTSEQTTMATMPRQMEVTEASTGRLVALR